MRNRGRLLIVVLAVLLIGLGSASAQEGGDIQAEMKADKSGTNPINFTFDARLYNEFLWLNTDGDGEQNISTFEFRAPFADGRWQFRTRVRSSAIKADINDDGVDDVDEWGIGDIDFRFLTVPYMNMKKKTVVATGFEVFLPTSSDDALGANALSFGPQVFAVFFKPFGDLFDLVAPAYQHKFSVYEESGARDVHQGLIDLFFLRTSPDKSRWALIDPQIVLDYESGKQFAQVDIEMGTMLDKYFGTKGHSAYIRPSFGMGGHRPSDASFEFGYKIIW